MSKTWVIGDVHGCLDELVELVSKLNVESSDTVILAGDLIDRGPNSPGVVEYAKEHPQITAIIGNHDEKCLRWFKREREFQLTGRQNRMSPPMPERLAQWEAISLKAREWLSQLPIMMEVGNWLIVHAGFEDKPLDKQKPDKMMRCRFISEETGEMVPISLEDDPWQLPKGAVWWSAKWRGPKNVVYGHAIHSLSTPRIDRYEAVECWGIDTGCVFGGHLTALNLDTREIVQVKAKRNYAKSVVDLAP